MALSSALMRVTRSRHAWHRESVIACLATTRPAPYQPLSTVEMNCPVRGLLSQSVPPGPVKQWPLVVSYQLKRNPFHLRRRSTAETSLEIRCNSSCRVIRLMSLAATMLHRYTPIFVGDV